MGIQYHSWTVSIAFIAFMAFPCSRGKLQTNDVSTGVIASFKNIGIRLCQLRCTEYGSCVNIEYNSETLVCRLLSTKAEKTEEGFVVRAKVPEGTFVIGSCKQQRCLETRSGMAVCVQATEKASRDRSTVQTLVEEGDYEGLKRLLNSEKVDLDVIGVNGQTPVMYAAKHGLLFMFKLLAKHGADMTVIDKFGSNILHLAVKGEMIQIVEYVLNHRNILDDNKEDNHGQTPLMIARSKGYNRIADLIWRAFVLTKRAFR